MVHSHQIVEKKVKRKVKKIVEKKVEKKSRCEWTINMPVYLDHLHFQVGLDFKLNNVPLEGNFWGLFWYNLSPSRNP